MALLWRNGPATAADVRRGLRTSGRWPTGRPSRSSNGSKKSTRRRHRQRGKAFVYAATRKPGPTYRRLVGRLLDRVFGGDAVSLVSSLFAGRARGAGQAWATAPAARRVGIRPAAEEVVLTGGLPMLSQTVPELNHAADAWAGYVANAAWQATRWRSWCSWRACSADGGRRRCGGAADRRADQVPRAAALPVNVARFQPEGVPAAPAMPVRVSPAVEVQPLARRLPFAKTSAGDVCTESIRPATLLMLAASGGRVSSRRASSAASEFRGLPDGPTASPTGRCSSE